ncbi:PQQ-binding-like beta-propeller repeat protein [Actinoplanes sp. NPDC026670]|uniref:outer membrane protein assembly factor BamB family protein n=1 Tax=Actinoplanes sp. NPDC026670 TaxID=3154700 RepID=UPI0033DCCB0F
MIQPLHVERILGDRPFAEVGEPILTVTTGGPVRTSSEPPIAVAADEPAETSSEAVITVAGGKSVDTSGATAGAAGPGGLVAMCGEFDQESNRAPVAVYDSDQRCLAVLRSRFPVHALAFHPTAPLLAVGTGRYDGGYFFEGELLLLDLQTGRVVAPFEDWAGRLVIGLEWLNDHELRLLMAPPDDAEDRAAWEEGHVAVVYRDDWRTVGPDSIPPKELAGPRGPAPRKELRALGGPRRNVRAVEQLSDGRVLAAMSGVAAACWLPSGEELWCAADDSGGMDLVVTPDERSVWSGMMRPIWDDVPQSLVRYSVHDGSRLDEFAPRRPYALVRSFDGQPVIASAGAGRRAARLRIRRGRRIYMLDIDRKSETVIAPGKRWLAATEPVALRANGRPREHRKARRLFPHSWVPDEWHQTGPGVEVANGELVHAGTVHNGRGLQPGGAFVVRRDMITGAPRWQFRTDHAATDLDADADTVFVAFRDGEIVALDLTDGSVRWRCQIPRMYPTAVTVPEPGRLLVGTSDGRILDCRVNGRVQDHPASSVT